ncbi:hypothetical protein BD309DRAFT_999290 [Dichomitus squalens]|uniref:Uncharacterized protein n=1 Tax=Dichomitus squalens TaxID=114155 RepID=A0A4Q9Q5E9_9APHY|nr:hypothetical protein BD309DRAFT_999290 [Dichomitus squalens]TBU62505.1 hypothetical protein BD310DRAFT_986391 [Dichomitus squalens]
MMMDGGWEDHLHFGFLGEHVLVDGLHLDSAPSFFIASLLTIVICTSERILTYAVSKQWHPWRGHRPSRVGLALWRACLYWLVTLDRLMYMLIGMTFSIGLIIVAVTTLAVGQFVIEYLDLGERPVSDSFPPSNENVHVKEPLLRSSEEAYEPETSYPPSRQSRSRARSKPESIFIHPNESNLARADAAAVQLGLSGDTDLVKGNVYPADGETWEHGRGRDTARELLGR